jgi:ASC-1-like (ASCH) protein
MSRHVAVFNNEAIQAIFKGKKSVESRFSQKKIAPFGTVKVGDTIYIKPPGKEIMGQFKVKKVISFDGIEEEDWQLIKQKFGKKISLGSKAADEKFYSSHKDAKFGTLIFIGNIEQFIASPIRLQKSDLRGWMVLD